MTGKVSRRDSMNASTQSKQIRNLFCIFVCMCVCMYICIYVYVTEIIIFVAYNSDGVYVNIYDCFYVCIRWL